MNKELIQKAIDHIAQDHVDLGRCGLFFGGKPYCALGHMASLVGINSYDYGGDPYEVIGRAYDMTPSEVVRVYTTNDDAGETRKQEVLDLLKGWLEAEPA